MDPMLRYMYRLTTGTSKYMFKPQWPRCELTQCGLHHKCQSEQSIIMRVLRDHEESKDIFKSCQKITHWSIVNGYETPHTKGN